MDWKIVFVGVDGKEMPVSEWCDLGDAAGDLNGGDAINDFVDKYGTVPFKEIKLVPSEVCNTQNFWHDEEE